MILTNAEPHNIIFDLFSLLVCIRVSLDLWFTSNSEVICQLLDNSKQSVWISSFHTLLVRLPHFVPIIACVEVRLEIFGATMCN